MEALLCLPIGIMDRTPPFGDHPGDVMIARIARRLLAVPPDDPLWRSAAQLNRDSTALNTAYRRGEITKETHREKLRVVAAPVLAQSDHAATEILVAASLLLLREEAAIPRPGCLN